MQSTRGRGNEILIKLKLKKSPPPPHKSRGRGLECGHCRHLPAAVPLAIVAPLVVPLVVVVPPPLLLSPLPWHCAPVLCCHTSPYCSPFPPCEQLLAAAVGGAVVVGGCAWFLVVVMPPRCRLHPPSPPQAVACSSGGGCWVGPSWLSLPSLWSSLWLLSLVVPSLSLFSPIFHRPHRPLLSGHPRHLLLDLWLSSSSSFALSCCASPPCSLSL